MGYDPAKEYVANAWEDGKWRVVHWLDGNHEEVVGGPFNSEEQALDWLDDWIAKSEREHFGKGADGGSGF